MINLHLQNSQCWVLTAATPMFKSVDDSALSTALKTIILGTINPAAGIAAIAWDNIKPDIWFNYEINAPSDRIKAVMYHELGHASHFELAGIPFWKRYINHIVFDGAYGDRNDQDSELVAMSESIAELLSVEIVDSEYGNDHSGEGGQYPAGMDVGRWIYRLEEMPFDGNSTNDDLWIPWGLWYDVVDNNNLNPMGINDNIAIDNFANFTSADIYNTLNPTVDSPAEVRDLLLNQLTGQDLIDLQQVFTSYGL